MLQKIAFFIATGAYSGLAPKAPGTWGTLACLLVWYFFIPLSSFPALSLLLPIIIVLVGTVATNYLLDHREVPEGEKDPQFVVIDEWAGLLIALVPISQNNIVGILMAFTLFRFFDITKLGPISRAEELPGGYGVMADDILAGLAALIVILIGQVFLEGVNV